MGPIAAHTHTHKPQAANRKPQAASCKLQVAAWVGDLSGAQNESKARGEPKHCRGVCPGTIHTRRSVARVVRGRPVVWAEVASRSHRIEEIIHKQKSNHCMNPNRFKTVFLQAGIDAVPYQGTSVVFI